MVKPILFSSSMVRAVLDERKTQTRRVARNKQKCPYGQMGDYLWVRETWNVCTFIDGVGIYIPPAIPKAHPGGDYTLIYKALDPEFNDWRPSIFMPRWASRILLKVTNTRLEPLQGIDAEDCVAEGIEHQCAVERPIQSFRSLWDSINAKRGFSFDSNPDVWVVEFELAEVKQ